MLLPVQRVGGGARHHYFEHPGVIVFAVPVRSQFDNGIVEIDTNAAAHAHDHSLAGVCFLPILEVLHQVSGHYIQALLGAGNRLQSCPFGFERLARLRFLAFSYFLEVSVDLGLFHIAKLKLCQTTLVVNGNGRLVFHSALNVVDADVLAKLLRCQTPGWMNIQTPKKRE